MKEIAALVSLCWLTSGFAQQVERQAGQHVIVIGVDGLSVAGVTQSKSPHLHQLISHAAWTLEARGVMPTLSSPNWASMITGAGPEQHGITSNGILHKMVELQPMCQDAEGMFPTMFEVLRKQRPAARIAVFHDWAGFADLVEKDVPDVMRHESGADKTTQAALQYWEENRPDLMFVHLDNVDHAGHESGWSSPPYLQAVEDADGYVGQFLKMLDRLSAGDSTYVLVTSDHGGKGKNHGKNSLAEIQIPWILAGPEVAAGPVAAAVYTFDTAATVAWILGINPPDCWIGRPVLTAFRATSVLAHSGGQLPSRECTTEPRAPTVGGSSGGGSALDLRGEPLAHRNQRD